MKTAHIMGGIIFLFLSQTFLFAHPHLADSLCQGRTIPGVFPIHLTGMGTCNAENTYPAPACASTYYQQGKKHLYNFAVTQPDTVDIFVLNPRDIYSQGFAPENLAFYLLKACPSQGTQSCVAFSEGGHSTGFRNIPLQADTVYYLLISSAQKCVDYDILIRKTPGYPANNLVPDPGFDGFEDGICGFHPLGSTLATHSACWSTPNDASTDIWSLFTYAPTCETNPLNRNPYALGQQMPHSGANFAGIMLNPPNNPAYREYVQVKLSQALVPGQPYELSWYQSKAERAAWVVGGLGGFFSLHAIDTLGFGELASSPQLITTQVVQDTGSWVKVAGTFQASSAFRYLNLGLVGSGQWQQVNPGGQNFAYYFIDDVVVRPLQSTPLPVASLYVKLQSERDGSRQLSWTSQDEQGVSHYWVERAGPDGQFFALGEPIESRGGPGVSAEYQYGDRSYPVREIGYYRVRVVDENGDFYFSETVEALPAEGADEVSVFPNPFEGQLSVFFPTATNRSIQIIVWDMVGNQLLNQQLQLDASGRAVLLAHTLAPGVYLARVSDGEKVCTVRLQKKE